jgi:hypothetical protein
MSNPKPHQNPMLANVPSGSDIRKRTRSDGIRIVRTGTFDADTMLAAGGKYTGDSTRIERGLSHDHTLWLRSLDDMVATADTTVAAGHR